MRYNNATSNNNAARVLPAPAQRLTSAKGDSFHVATSHSNPNSENRPYFVYVIAAPSGAVKIGVASNIANRLNSIQTGNHEQLTVAYAFQCATVADAYALEGKLHAHFASERIRGEWFGVHPDAVAEAARRTYGAMFAEQNGNTAYDDEFHQLAAWWPYIGPKRPVYVKPTNSKLRQRRQSHKPLRREDTEVLAEAAALALRLGKASISLFQRRLGIGYERAASIFGALQNSGFFGRHGFEQSRPNKPWVRKH